MTALHENVKLYIQKSIDHGLPVFILYVLDHDRDVVSVPVEQRCYCSSHAVRTEYIVLKFMNT